MKLFGATLAIMLGLSHGATITINGQQTLPTSGTINFQQSGTQQVQYPQQVVTYPQQVVTYPQQVVQYPQQVVVPQTVVQRPTGGGGIIGGLAQAAGGIVGGAAHAANGIAGGFLSAFGK
ncbi:uncharacterized protein LOC106082283 [Stomoxys calcitrans]|uniref:uncharacterized protein LOC106082283 n=1 Tax=Stomoxys calcitrans TaxID=35570 RepID=UPI0027E26660|nr:uncharacterized protein LOC106082283 [Stomoxys calcitrans]